MLEIQKRLQNGETIDQISQELGLRVTRHPTDKRMIVNYDQIESPKSHPIVREARGLVSHSESYEVLGRAFNRFFNWGEMSEEMPLFDWSDCFAQSKEDGSIMVLYFHDGWKVNTRGSFADSECGFSGKTWSQLFFEVVDIEKVKQICREGYSYVFEFCSLHNKIVRTYREPKAFLLSVFENSTGKEIDRETVDSYAQALGVDRPELFLFKSIDEVIKYVSERGGDGLNGESIQDPTFEGVVICDKNGRRWKIKSPLYLSLHKMRGEGDNLYNPKYILPFIMAGETDELLCYFPEVTEKTMQMKAEVDKALADVLELWEQVKDITDQKTFAISVVGKTKFSALFFNARKLGVSPKTLWPQAEDLILKVLFNS